MTVALSCTRPALHDGVPSRMRVLTEAPPLPLKTLWEEREIHRVSQAASEQRTDPTVNLPKEDDIHRQKTSPRGTALQVYRQFD